MGRCQRGTKAGRSADCDAEGAQQHSGVDLIDELRRNADSQIEYANERKKLADAAQPLHASLNEQQKNRFADMLFGGDRERDNRRMDRTSD
jgi:hypothetical protein